MEIDIHMNRPFVKLLVTAWCTACVPAAAETLTQIVDFGDNPDEVAMYVHLPNEMPDNAALVVSLHGCTQDVETYSKSGWIPLADQHKFYVIFPEQSRLNNPLNCWNWFEAANLIRGQGEIQSIVNMVEYMKSHHSIDATRIYIEGLSAGGFLTPVILANYPEVFAAGATHAGGPAFCARTKQYFWDVFGWWYAYQAKRNFDKCADGIDQSPEAWGKLAREYGYSEYDGEWPKLSIWHGVSDDVVEIANQTELLEQWSYLLNIDTVADIQLELETPSGVIHTEYHDAQGEVQLETWIIAGMEHGTPIDEISDGNCGMASEYVLDAGICAVEHIAAFWGLNR